MAEASKYTAKATEYYGDVRVVVRRKGNNCHVLTLNGTATKGCCTLLSLTGLQNPDCAEIDREEVCDKAIAALIKKSVSCGYSSITGQFAAYPQQPGITVGGDTVRALLRVGGKISSTWKSIRHPGNIITQVDLTIKGFQAETRPEFANMLAPVVVKRKRAPRKATQVEPAVKLA